MPLFSIIVPVYKTEQYLDKCILSILQQTYSDFEVILVDDGSPDKCPQICDEYEKKDNRIKVIHKENGGVSSARNSGMALATGKYIWFIDSDDYIETDSLQRLYDIQNKYVANLYIFNNTFVSEVYIKNMDEFLERYYFTYLLGFEPWNKLYERSIIQENGLYFDTQETIGEDLLFNINYYRILFMKQQGSIFFVGQKYYQYVERGESAMNSASKNRIKQQLRLFDKIQDKLNQIINEKSIMYLFLMHLISGINQSKQGQLSCEEFARIDFNKYSSFFYDVDEIKDDFLRNEHASQFGKIKCGIFLYLMKRKKYKIAGKIMGLK